MAVPRKLGRYQIIRVCGTGAMAQVYEAFDPDLNRSVAIKTIGVEHLSKRHASEFRSRFKIEAKAAGRLQHPNIISTFDAGLDEGVAYLVMEYFRGSNIKERFEGGDEFSIKRSLSIVSQLLEALDYAHSQHVIHRDIKLANLMINQDDHVKLVDFGVARIMNSGDATRADGSMVGTLRYMAPEQVRGESVDHRADIFSAGVVLYQLLTRQVPFDGESDFEIIQKIVDDNPMPPQAINSSVPRLLDGVISRALAKKRADRFSSAREFANALGAAVQSLRQAGSPTPKHSELITFVPQITGRAEDQWGSRPGAESRFGKISDSPVLQELELLYWKEIRESGDVDDFEEFISRFGGGVYESIARRRLRQLLSSDTTRSHGEGRAEQAAEPANIAGDRVR